MLRCIQRFALALTFHKAASAIASFTALPPTSGHFHPIDPFFQPGRVSGRATADAGCTCETSMGFNDFVLRQASKAFEGIDVLGKAAQQKAALIQETHKVVCGGGAELAGI